MDREDYCRRLTQWFRTGLAPFKIRNYEELLIGADIAEANFRPRLGSAPLGRHGDLPLPCIRANLLRSKNLFCSRVSMH